MEGKEAESGGFAARVVILLLEGNMFVFITGKKTPKNYLPVFMYSRAQRTFFCMRVSKMEEQVSRCTGAFLTPLSGLV